MTVLSMLKTLSFQNYCVWFHPDPSKSGQPHVPAPDLPAPPQPAKAVTQRPLSDQVPSHLTSLRVQALKPHTISQIGPSKGPAREIPLLLSAS